MNIAALFVYGVILGFFVFLLAGFGHGCYVLFGLAGSPFSILGILSASSEAGLVTLLAGIFQWALLFALARWLHFRRWVIATFLVLHYGVASYALLAPSSPFSDWDDLSRIPHSYHLLLPIGLTWYAAGQIWMWVCLWRGEPKRS